MVTELGQVHTVLNTAKKTNADKTYRAFWLVTPMGQKIPLLMTEEEWKRCVERAYKNDEDVPALVTSAPNTWQRIKNYFFE